MTGSIRQIELNPRLENLELIRDSRGYRSVYPQDSHECSDSRKRSNQPNQRNLRQSRKLSQPWRNGLGNPTEGGAYLSDYRTVNSNRNTEELRHFVPDTTASSQRFQQQTRWDISKQANSEMRMPAQSRPH